jgi:hypothetical protein
VRCIVTVATGRYVPLQERMIGSLSAAGYRDGLLRWTDSLPPGSPSHEQVPYGFKVYAFREARRRGSTSVLWLDAPAFARASVDPLFEAIERSGHLFVGGEERLGRWSSQACLEAFGLSRAEATQAGLMNGTFIGLDLTVPRTLRWFEEWARACERGLFNGNHGHRHDEAVGSCLAWRLGMGLGGWREIFETGPLAYDKSLDADRSGHRGR